MSAYWPKEKKEFLWKTDLIQCPYEFSHFVYVKRIQKHLVKCRKNHPELAEKIIICPFSAAHHFPKDKIEEHYKECRARKETYCSILAKSELREDEKCQLDIKFGIHLMEEEDCS